MNKRLITCLAGAVMIAPALVSCGAPVPPTPPPPNNASNPPTPTGTEAPPGGERGNDDIIKGGRSKTSD